MSGALASDRVGADLGSGGHFGQNGHCQQADVNRTITTSASDDLGGPSGHSCVTNAFMAVYKPNDLRRLSQAAFSHRPT